MITEDEFRVLNAMGISDHELAGRMVRVKRPDGSGANISLENLYQRGLVKWKPKNTGQGHTFMVSEEGRRQVFLYRDIRDSRRRDKA